ncbi:uncharacterized protein BT62DRAFT_1013722 [Guyanagaster necrorhizus]|uniref:Uncharacterized protein n=1 Tax=Guyanagaster necrorhizus TaxID=856835 RepID=A0A9P7VEQ7_9AGAR|nr:uncharacterized protein BT62DRAFT_1013722 [Guyanagaster necrorhizus MCA 3950]KAG7439576.1 hypothetical protein BT62DRAFT_1013722 [Guyanagaster necrorhizus MCA 3950]
MSEKSDCLDVSSQSRCKQRCDKEAKTYLCGIHDLKTPVIPIPKSIRSKKAQGCNSFVEKQGSVRDSVGPYPEELSLIFCLQLQTAAVFHTRKPRDKSLDKQRYFEWSSIYSVYALRKQFLLDKSHVPGVPVNQQWNSSRRGESEGTLSAISILAQLRALPARIRNTVDIIVHIYPFNYRYYDKLNAKTLNLLQSDVRVILVAVYVGAAE